MLPPPIDDRPSLVRSIRFVKVGFRPEPTVVRPPWSVLFSLTIPTGLPLFRPIASAERASAAIPLSTSATGSPNPADIRTICCARSASKHLIAGIRRSTGITYRGIRRVACAACRICAHEAYNAASVTRWCFPAEQGIDRSYVRAFINPGDCVLARTIHVLPGIADLPFGGCAHHRRSSDEHGMRIQTCWMGIGAIPAQAHLHRPDVPKTLPVPRCRPNDAANFHDVRGAISV